MDLLLAIILALNSYLGPASTTSSTLNSDDQIAKAKYILENNLYQADGGGVIIDPDVSL